MAIIEKPSTTSTATKVKKVKRKSSVMKKQGEVLMEWKRNGAANSTALLAASISSLDWSHSSQSAAMVNAECAQQLSPPPKKKNKLEEFLGASNSSVLPILEGVKHINEHVETGLKNVWNGLTGDNHHGDQKYNPDEKWVYDYSEEYELLHFTPADVVGIVTDDAAFQTLKRSLQKRNHVTNLYLQQTLHHYVKHVKDVRERNAKRLERKLAREQQAASYHHQPLVNLHDPLLPNSQLNVAA
ncbi:expressed unknown protein [Seminavis robusta]|uniref:Uncharacterized protein n=1 Tax=Seminavis robusta TaxID=568900 RepID=A0A9N8EA05_9STRA|nr:expressed unknown protein [Seminavis robusta]|eukprot:Sro660_g183050.1 n/a (242) ;mRNA; f:38119-38844